MPTVLTITILNNSVSVPVSGVAFNRCKIRDGRALIIDVRHENGDNEGFSIPFEAVSPLLERLKEAAEHPSIVAGECR